MDRKFLNAICPLEVGHAVAFTYMGQNLSGHIVEEIAPKAVYKIAHPSGADYTVNREDIPKRLKRVTWAGVSEQLYQFAQDEGKERALEECGKIISSLETLLEIGTQNQKGPAVRLLKAVHFAQSEILK